MRNLKEKYCLFLVPQDADFSDILDAEAYAEGYDSMMTFI